MATKIVPVILLSLCALLGGYASIYTSTRDGFIDALKSCTSPPKECILDAPRLAQVPSYTTITAVDSVLAVVFEFFSQGLSRRGDGGSLEALLAVTYLAVQFGGAWYLMALEGLRRGNVRTMLSWWVAQYLDCKTDIS